MKKTILSLSILALTSTLIYGAQEPSIVDPYKKLFIQQSRHPIGNLNSMLIFLADQIDINNDSKYFSQPTIVTSFVSLNNLKETSQLGRLISESLMHELQVRKWSVIEIKMSRDMAINHKGEFYLSRDIDKIKKTFRARSIVTGTYVVSDDTVIINAKVLNIDSGIILSSAQVAIPLDSVASMVFENQSESDKKEEKEDDKKSNNNGFGIE
jgi:TolB-like protein